MRAATTRAGILSLIAVVVLTVGPVRAQDESRGPIVGQIPKSGGPAAPAAAAKNPVDSAIGNLSELSTPLDWARALVKLTKTMDRKQALKHIAAHPDYAKLNGGLNLGRKGLIRAILMQGMEYGNGDLDSRNLSAINRVLGLNCGSTGDFNRDNDITCYAGDDLREDAFFKGVTRTCGELGFEVKISPGSIDIPELEVSLFRGGNDIPDARYAKDVSSHVQQYRKAIQKQRTSKEAYKGKAVMVELAGKIASGQAEIQEITRNPKTGSAEFNGHLPQTFREVRSIFHGSATFRAERWELASHMVSNTLSALRGHHDNPTKGALKYAGRNVASLCAFHGFKPWDKLNTDDRVRLLAKVMTNFDVGKANQREVLEKMAATLDVGFKLQNKTGSIAGMSPAELATARQVSEIFLRRTVATTGASMALAMLDPPPYTGLDSLPPAERRRFDAMSPEQRFEFWCKKDDIYRRCVSFEAMEDLLMTMVELRQLDLELRKPDPSDPTAHLEKNGRPKLRQPGYEAMRLMIDQAPAKARPLLRLAKEYAFVYTASGQAGTPEQCIRQMNRLYDIRSRMKKRLGKGTTPGGELMSKMAKVKPKAFMANESSRKPSLFGRACTEANLRFQAHIKEAFPSLAQTKARFEADLKRMGKMNYAKQCLAQEIFQMDTLADGLALVDMYQRGAGTGDYAYFVTVNVLSRFHWSFGNLIAAAQVRDVKALKAVGKNVFFATAARLVPSAGYIKVLFDVAQGTVNVTVGYTVRGENAELVDALYCGPHYLGPVDRPRIKEGTVANARREAGFCMLSSSHFREIKDPDTGRTASIALNRPQIYADAFTRWTGSAYDDLDDRTKASKKAPKLVAAHDALVKLIIRQAESTGPLWVQKPRKDTPNFHVDPDEEDFSKAITALYPLLTAQCRAEARKVLVKGAARTYRSWLDEKDVIEEELVQRYTADVFGGIMELWESRLTAQRLAKRQIERTAMQADLSELAKHLAKSTFSFPKKKPRPKVKVRVTPRGAKPTPELFEDYDMDAIAEGLGIAVDALDEFLFGEDEDGIVSPIAVLDGAMPITFAPLLVGEGDASDAKDVAVAIAEEKLTVIARADGEKDDGTIGPGDLVAVETTFEARDDQGAGEVLSEETVTVLVRMPEAADNGTWPIRHRKREITIEGGWIEEYDYIDIPFEEDLPKGWKRSGPGNEVVHGKMLDVVHDDGDVQRLEVTEYRFGRRHGVHQIANPDGTVVLQEHFENDLLHGPAECVDSEHHDSDMPEGGRCRATFERGQPRTDEVFTKEGVRVQLVTFRPRSETGPANLLTGVPEVLYEGEVREWWPSGKPKRGGAYIQGDGHRGSGHVKYDGFRHQISTFTRVGVWTTHHENGRIETKVAYENDEPDGSFESYAEDGTVTAKGAYRKGKQVGKWTYWHDSGLLLVEGAYRDGVMTGKWMIYEDDKDDREPWVFEDAEKEWEHIWQTLRNNGFRLRDL